MAPTVEGQGVPPLAMGSATPPAVAAAAGPPASTRRGRGGRARGVLSALALLVAILVVWQVCSMLFGSETASGVNTVPSPLDTIKAVPEVSNFWNGGFGIESPALGGQETVAGGLLALGENALSTLYRFLAGVALGLAVGVGLGLAVSWARVLREGIGMVAHMARMMPLLAMVPLFGLWFGPTSKGVIFFVAFSVFVVVFVVTVNAVQNVPKYYGQYARSLGASNLRVYREVVFPAILPELRGGILLSLGFAWSAVIAGEFLGQQLGLGRIVQRAGFFSQTDLLALIGVVTVILAGLTFLLASKALGWATRWAED